MFARVLGKGCNSASIAEASLTCVRPDILGPTDQINEEYGLRRHRGPPVHSPIEMILDSQVGMCVVAGDDTTTTTTTTFEKNI